MSRLTTVLVTIAALSLVACKDPNAGVPRATTTRVAPPTAAPTPAAPTPAPTVTAERLTFAPPTSSISFTGAKVTGTHTGSFGAFTGTMNLNAARLTESGPMRVVIEMASVTTDTERLTGHLKSPDFFDVAQFARATFTSTAIREGGANGATHTVVGTLELHGQTREVTFPATIAVTAAEVTARAEFVLNRRDFGIVYAGMPDNLIRDEVSLNLNLRAPRGGGEPANPPAMPGTPPPPTTPPAP